MLPSLHACDFAQNLEKFNLAQNSWWWLGCFPGWVCEELPMMAKVAPSDCQDPPRSGFRKPHCHGQGFSQEWPSNYVFFFCYLVASIEVHNTCVKKWEILFLSKRTFLQLSMSNFLTKLAYVLQVAMTPRNENLEKKVRQNQMINLKFVVSIYNYISMFRNMVSILWLKMGLKKPIDA
jgi:hypothetical protein